MMLISSVEHNILTANELDVKFLCRKAKKLLEMGADYSDLYLQDSESESFALDEGIIKSASFAKSTGIGIRAICGDKSFLSYANSLHPSTITSLVDDMFIEPAHNHPSMPQHTNNKPVTQLYTFTNPINHTAQTDKLAMLNLIDILGRKEPYVSNVIANLSFEYDEICIINSEDCLASDVRPLVHLSITIIVNKNGQMEKGYSGCGGRYLLDELNNSELLQQHVAIAHKQALLKLEAKDAPAGVMPVVLGNAWAGVILHEAVGHGLEGDFNRRGSSAFTNKIGEQVASKLVTVIDEGCISSRRGSLNIDDEGTPTQRTVLIENGILKGYMFDKLNAKLMNTISTGNGRRESFCCSPMPRMTNTYMLSGNNTPEEVIASVENGLYAENFDGGQVDITSGQFVFNANVAWVIKNGKLAYPVKGCALVGNGPECLKHVSMVANNSALDSGIGVCGKDGQTVPVGVGQPTIRIDSGLVVGGQ